MRHRLSDVVVLLPGILGSALRKDGHEVWNVSVAASARGLATLGGSVKGLTLDADPPDVDDLEDGVKADGVLRDLHLLPYLWKIDGYTKIAERIRASFDVQVGSNYFEFAYDWRRDNRVAARRLAVESRRWLAGWRSSSGNPHAKLILVAHSMGGLVARYFLEVLDGWEDTKILVTFGTPYQGSVGALDTLVNGIRKGPLGLLDLSAMVRSFTSMYQLLPVYPCVDCGDPALALIGEAPGVPNVDPSRAAQALAFHREIQRAVDRRLANEPHGRERHRIVPIVGTHQPTLQSARVTGSGHVEMLSSYLDEDEDGDGTVPRVSATPSELAGEGREVFVATRHASLQNSDAVLTQLEGVITGYDLDLTRYRTRDSSPLRLCLDVEPAYWHDEPVSIRVLTDPVPSPLLTAVVSEVGRPERVAHAVFGRGSQTWQTAEFRPLPPGTYRISVSDNARTAEVSDVFVIFDHHLS